MSIPSWISKTAHELGEPDKPTPVNFSDTLYEKLLSMYKEGKLDEWASGIVEEIEYLRDVINVAADKVGAKVLGMSKQAAPASVAVPELPKDTKDVENLVPEVPPAMPSGKAPGAPSANGPRLRPRIKEPETTKWKEIRFNKRTGTWQCVITTRHVRNFATENEAIEFTKKAALQSFKILDPNKIWKGDGIYVVREVTASSLRTQTILGGPYASREDARGYLSGGQAPPNAATGEKDRVVQISKAEIDMYGAATTPL